MLFQLARHNKELQALLKTYGEGDEALEFYAKHTAQIEVSHFSLIQESQPLWLCPCRCPLPALKSSILSTVFLLCHFPFYYPCVHYGGLQHVFCHKYV